jgi:hypothetical protein
MSAPAKKQESALVKFVVSGTVTLGYELVLGHFLEFLKGKREEQEERKKMQCNVCKLLMMITDNSLFVFCFSGEANVARNLLSVDVTDSGSKGSHWSVG